MGDYAVVGSPKAPSVAPSQWTLHQAEEPTHNRLGMLNGVVIPVSLNVMGVILFLRLSWSVGQAGWLGAMLLLTLAEVQSILTVLSLSAMVSNGRMGGGGSYFMMSRSLGPELGVAMGCLFYTAFAVSAAFYAIGFATEMRDTWFNDNHNRWLLTGLASAALFVMFLISLAGAASFTKINVWLFVVQFGSIFVALCSMWFAGEEDLKNGGEFLGPSVQRLRDNVFEDFSESDECGGMCSWTVVFGIIFPAATGIMEGANLSGDLADPAGSIGKGTLLAIGFAIINYFALIVTFGAGFTRTTLQENTGAMQDATFEPYIVVVGILVSSASSTLGALFGGSRILQAIARDNILPGIGYFAKGSTQGNEPRRAVVFTWFIAQCCVFIGDLDVVAPLISSFFCLSYAMTNLACFLLAVSGTPNFRPRFKLFSWKTSLVGFLLNLLVMFLLNWVYALVSLVLFIALVVYLLANAPETAWGDVRQAIIWHQVRKYLLKLDERKAHGKLWRPSVLLLVDNLRDPLVRFCNILKKGGVYVLGNTLRGTFEKQHGICQQMHLRWLQFIDEHKLKAFPHITVAPSARLGYQNILFLSGLGAMTPNTVVLPFYEPPRSLRRSDGDDEDDEVDILASSAPPAVGRLERSGSMTSYYAEQAALPKAPLSPSAPNAARKLGSWESHFLSTAVRDALEYVQILNDVALTGKNVVVAHHFKNMPLSFEGVEEDENVYEGRFDLFGTSPERRSSRAQSSYSHSLNGFGAPQLRKRKPSGGDFELDGTRDFEASASQALLSVQVPEGHDSIDVWLTSKNATQDWQHFTETPLLLVQLAHIVSRRYADKPLRLFRVVDGSASAEDMSAEFEVLKHLVKQVRVDFSEDNIRVVRFDSPDAAKRRAPSFQPSTAASQVSDIWNTTPTVVDDDVFERENRNLGVSITPASDPADVDRMNALIASFSAQSFVIFTEIVKPPSLQDLELDASRADEYMQLQERLARSLPPTLMVQEAQLDATFSRDI